MATLPPLPPLQRKQPAAFTLVEVLLATAILLVLMVVLFNVIGAIAATWKKSSGQISAFQNARSAFTTINETLSRATLNTYVDYVDKSGNPGSLSDVKFVPASFARQSELHFLCGPAGGTDGYGLLTKAGLDAPNAPGHAIFFQAPFGYTCDNYAGGGNRAVLGRTLNNIGFFVNYTLPDNGRDPNRLLPGWISKLFGGNTYRFQLQEYVQPTEAIKTYTFTSGTTGGSSYPDVFAWLKDLLVPPSENWTTGASQSEDAPRARVLAEDVLLLLFRPRLSPDGEAVVAGLLGTTYDDSTRGSILSPNFRYDSRAWQNDFDLTFPGCISSNATATPNRYGLMRNQTPPIVDVVMVCADRQSLARLNGLDGKPPTEVQLPPGLFTNSGKQDLDKDLTTYGKQLTKYHIRFRIFRSSVQIASGIWSNN